MAEVQEGAMDIEKLYENIILRDLFQYLTPGSIFLVGLCIFLDAVLRRLDASLSVFAVLNGSTIGVVFALISAYAAGNLLTGICALLLRGGEKQRTVVVLEKNKWLAKQVEYLAKDYFQSLESGEAENSLILDDASLREIVRALIHHRMPLLNREFVVRHSILSRFCQNMAVALITLLIFVPLAAWVSWNELALKVQPAPVLVTFVVIFMLFLTILSIIIFWHRAGRLRDMMIKHTFQIWYTDYVELHLEKKQKTIVK